VTLCIHGELHQRERGDLRSMDRKRGTTVDPDLQAGPGGDPGRGQVDDVV